MKIYQLENGRVLVDFKAPAPLVSIPNEMWNDGLNEFKGIWVSCCFTKSYTEKDRVLYTIYRSDTIAAKRTPDGEPIEIIDDNVYVIMPTDTNVVTKKGTKDCPYDNYVEKIIGEGSDADIIRLELKKGKICLYYGTKDTTGEGWDKFCCTLHQKECITSELGSSYREINWNDTRCWWEFHIYDESVRTKGHRPIPIFTENVVDSL